MQLLPELVELNRIRLSEDLTYSELAVRVGLKGGGGGLNRLLSGQRHPLDRTLYKIRRYLDARRPQGGRKTTRQREQVQA